MNTAQMFKAWELIATVRAIKKLDEKQNSALSPFRVEVHYRDCAPKLAEMLEVAIKRLEDILTECPHSEDPYGELCECSTKMAMAAAQALGKIEKIANE